MATIKKAQRGEKLSPKDSMNIYANRYDSLSAEAAKKLGSGKNASKDIEAAKKARANENRLSKKVYGTTPSNKKGGVVKKKMKNGGSLSGLKASNKRVGPIDPKGAWTKVQEKTLAGAKGKASLTRDKELGATKMKMGGKAKKK
jgi:hypothetical protein